MASNYGARPPPRTSKLWNTFNRKPCLITDAPWYVPNVVIRNDLQIPTIKEITLLSYKYSAGLNMHPNHLVTQLSNPPAFRRLRKLLPSDLPYRFTQNTFVILYLMAQSTIRSCVNIPDMCSTNFICKCGVYEPATPATFRLVSYCPNHYATTCQCEMSVPALRVFSALRKLLLQLLLQNV
jgi:hypothetical protein